MTAVFISYRREGGAAAAGTLYDVLARRYKTRNVFRDVESIPAGASFSAYISTALQVCDVMLVVIGSGWLNLRDDAGKRRLDDPADLVRLEIATALRQDKLVMPLLVDGATMPAASDLPPDMAALAGLQAITVRDIERDALLVLRQMDASMRWRIPHMEALAAAILLPVGWGVVAWMLSSVAYRGLGVVLPVVAGFLAPWLLVIARNIQQRQWLWFYIVVRPMAPLLLFALLPLAVPVPSWLTFSATALAVAVNVLTLANYGLRGPRYVGASDDPQRDVGRAVAAAAAPGMGQAGSEAAAQPQRNGWRVAILVCALVGLICLGVTVACYSTAPSFTSPQWFGGTLIFLPGVLFGFAAVAIAYARLLHHEFTLPARAEVVRPWGGYVPSSLPGFAGMWRRVGWAVAITIVPFLLGVALFARVGQSAANSPLFGVYLACFAALFPLAALIFVLAWKDPT